jgi:hypothetical protein
MAKSAEPPPRRALVGRKHSAATAGTDGKSESNVSPPHLDFVGRYSGSLPETIAESDLEILNQGLGFLFALMREARRLNNEGADNGRAAAFTALGAMWQFVVLFESPLAELLHMPILSLQDALVGLDNNLVLPILKPVARAGRAPTSHAHATLKGYAAGTVKRLVGTGLRRSDAHQAVAKELKRLGVRAERGSGSVTANTVRNWCDEVSSDVGRRGTAALMHDQMIKPREVQRFSAMPKDQARSEALAELAWWVQSVLRPAP